MACLDGFMDSFFATLFLKNKLQITYLQVVNCNTNL